MKNTSVAARNYIVHALYLRVLKPIFFKFDPEYVHDHMVRVGRILGSMAPLRGFTRLMFGYSDPRLEQTILGMKFKNPVGLAAGFDKNAELTDILGSVGFGLIEVGSITGYACPGNPKPRLWRLPASRGLLVYYGLKNDGCEVIAKRLTKKFQLRKPDVIIGTSVAMTNNADNNDLTRAIADYAKAFRSFVEIGDYFTINISCPNTQGGQPFIQPDALERLLSTIDLIGTNKPIFIKISADMSIPELDVLLDVVRWHRVHGIICVNLTKKRDNPKILDKDLSSKGGISGKPVQESSDRLLAHIYKREGKRFVLIGLGGIFSAEDAYKKIRLGASVVQMVTGMIFEGPQVVSEINRGLVKLLEKDGFSNISEAIGVDNS
ncbi:MAG: quinone-dependent dihydroorotate dehydrogenase [Patescibacteria group bacterium]